MPSSYTIGINVTACQLITFSFPPFCDIYLFIYLQLSKVMRSLMLVTLFNLSFLSGWFLHTTFSSKTLHSLCISGLFLTHSVSVNG